MPAQQSNQIITPSRYDFLDNIKWFITILVILHHSASVAGLDPIGFNLPKVIAPYHWQYGVLNDFQSVNQSFFMSLFFFISALFVILTKYVKQWLVLQGISQR